MHADGVFAAAARGCHSLAGRASVSGTRTRAAARCSTKSAHVQRMLARASHKFAMLEATLALAILVHNFNFRWVPVSGCAHG
jgi:hypothetical protein